MPRDCAIPNGSHSSMLAMGEVADVSQSPSSGASNKRRLRAKRALSEPVLTVEPPQIVGCAQRVDQRQERLAEQPAVIQDGALAHAVCSARFFFGHRVTDAAHERRRDARLLVEMENPGAVR